VILWGTKVKLRKSSCWYLGKGAGLDQDGAALVGVRRARGSGADRELVQPGAAEAGRVSGRAVSSCQRWPAANA
jgi:hypothetical protein